MLARITFVISVTFLISGCFNFGDPIPVAPIKVLLLQFPDRPPIPYSAADYSRHLFDASGTYRFTPKNNPVFGSVREWFEYTSNGLYSPRGDVRNEVILSPVTWAEVMRLSDASEKWFAQSIREIALSGAGIDINDNSNSYMYIHNGDIVGWTFGNNIELPAVNGADGDITPIGLFVHEISHMQLHQPDRYFFYFGKLNTWDVMASSYGNFPSVYSAQGMVDVGLARYEQPLRKTTQVYNIPPHLDTNTFPRFRSSLYNELNNEESFFTFENRTARNDIEQKIMGPREGLLLIENDMKTLNVAPKNGSASNSEIVEQKIHLHKNTSLELFNELIGLPEAASWALPYIDASSGRTIDSFNCVEGGSLNVLGECLWSFSLLSSDDSNKEILATYLVKSLALNENQKLIIPANDNPQRLYFNSVGGFVFKQSGSSQGIPLNRTLFPTRRVLDIPPTSNDTEFEMVGQENSELIGAELVERTKAVTYAHSTQREVVLSNGTTWLNPAYSLNSLTSVFVWLLQSQIMIEPGKTYWGGVLRIVLSYPQSTTIDSLRDRYKRDNTVDVTEKIQVNIVGADPVNGQEFTRKLFTGQVPVIREEPFVIQVSFSMPNSAISVYPMLMIQRDENVVNEPLHLLSVDVSRVY